jgi:hypothetical protein
VVVGVVPTKTLLLLLVDLVVVEVPVREIQNLLVEVEIQAVILHQRVIVVAQEINHTEHTDRVEAEEPVPLANQATAVLALVVTDKVEPGQHGQATVNHTQVVVVEVLTMVTHGTECSQEA